MLESQKVALRASEIRTRLAELAGKEGELGEEERSEIAKLRTEYTDVETRFQAAATAEDVVETHTDESAEDREYRAMVDSAELGEIYSAAVEHRMTEGAEAELQKHLGLSANQVPLALLLSEERAVTVAPTNTESSEQPVVPSVFAAPVAEFLSIDQPTVGAGDAVFPVITKRPDVGGPHKASEVVDETTGTFSADMLAPSRIQASYFYRRTDAARFKGMSEALRENLSMGLADGLDKQIVSGSDGLLTGTNLPNHDSAGLGTFAVLLPQFSYARVDGRYAGDSMQIRSVVGNESYGFFGGLYRAGSSDATTVLGRLGEITGGVRVSAHVPGVSSKKQNGVIRRGSRRDMVAPIWEGVTLIPDEVTKAKSGEIVITAVLLHAVKILRADGFYKQQVQTLA